MEDKFIVKDSGKREEFKSGMVRDTSEGKVEWHRIFDGPLMERYAVHLTKGKQKYPDVKPGVPNWTLAEGEAELCRFKQSAVRHFIQAIRGDTDEDHFAATVFNLNGMLFIQEKLKK